MSLEQHPIMRQGPTHSDFTRLEDKVDKLAELFGQLLVFEERQQQQTHRIDLVEERQEKADERITAVSGKLDKWISMGMGAWALAVTAWTIFQGLKH